MLLQFPGRPVKTAVVWTWCHDSRITRDHRAMGGRPCIRSMRVTVATIVGLLAHGRTRQAVLEAYPYLDPEDLTEALADAARRAMEVDVEIGVP